MEMDGVAGDAIQPNGRVKDVWIVNDKADESATNNCKNNHGDFAKEVFVAGVGHEAPAHDDGRNIKS